MPVSVCPHCQTQLWVKNAQLNVAQGFVVCSRCEGLFQARNHITEAPAHTAPEALPPAITDAKLVHTIGPQVRSRKTLSKNEIADLLDGIPPAGTAPAPPPAATQTGFNWTLASLVALTVLIMQLFYLILLR
ncbi:hypothetical protein LVJ83_02365 [Uruburuella testudinis]|uniref:MJ0042 family finger-like domain-containing protein n=1 Tax=Uruburuella testudinis TaxID=1282863 RepID=A0ABY4DTH0_9NEIS|nr:MJ0042-type zinc finger domain-containing protein [Uruburuella testudinis]UOO82339.1 hypothetical protein LVJ83_02365 [Uruburuella testudinis]